MYKVRVEQDRQICEDEECEAALVIVVKRHPFVPQAGYVSIVNTCKSYEPEANKAVIAAAQQFLMRVPTYEGGENNGD